MEIRNTVDAVIDQGSESWVEEVSAPWVARGELIYVEGYEGLDGPCALVWDKGEFRIVPSMDPSVAGVSQALRAFTEYDEYYRAQRGGDASQTEDGDRNDDADDAAAHIEPVDAQRPNLTLGFHLFVGAIGLLAAVSGILGGTAVSVLAAGLLMFAAGALGGVEANRRAFWYSLEIGGIGIALVAILALVLSA